MINSFPGYEYIQAFDSLDGKPHNMYKGFDVGFGGFVYAEPGMYRNVTVIDTVSMHPSSIIALNYFGDYTPKFEEILEARKAIKHKDFDKARTMLNGKLAPYLEDESQAKMLAQALKIAINSVYGLTSAKFSNPMKDDRNVNNIVALRGALFMIDLKEEVEKRGYQVMAIKTDSMKIVGADDDIVQFASEFGKQYGYTFETENIFEKICLVNNAVFIAKCAKNDPETPGEWKAVGAEFQHPYIFKTLFTHEDVVFEDLCETKAVTTALYLDMNESLPEGEHEYQFVGKVGSFCPMLPYTGGGLLMAQRGDKFNAATGSSGYRWLESETVKQNNKEADIDMSYFEKLAEDAKESINKFGNFDQFVCDKSFEDFMNIPDGCEETGVPWDEN